MLSPSVSSPARIFVDVQDPRTFLEGLERPGGIFVPTRLRPVLGQTLLLAMRLDDSMAPIDLPVTVIARRTPKGAGGLLSLGVHVGLVDPAHPAAVWLRRVVDAQAIDPAVTPRVFSVFPVAEDLVYELRRLADGERGMLPVDRQVHVGDRLHVTATAEDAPGSVSLRVLVKGTSLHDGLRAFSAELLDEEGRREALRFLEENRSLPRPLR